MQPVFLKWLPEAAKVSVMCSYRQVLQQLVRTPYI
jgi:hypothetical protein